MKQVYDKTEQYPVEFGPPQTKIFFYTFIVPSFIKQQKEIIISIA